MRKSSIKYLAFSLFIIEMISLFLTFKSYGNKDITEIKETNEVNKEMFSMYVENDEGKYEEYKDGETFEISGYKLNINKSNCVDNKGNAVSGVIANTNNKVTVSSNKTVFCYLYFDIDRSVYAKVVSDYTNSNGVSKTSSTSAETGNEYDVYYYTGDITNNNILYGGFCWKMVITTETNGVKLIYNGVPTTVTDDEGNVTYNCDNTGTDSQLSSTKAFNSNYNSLAYVGYMYNTVYPIQSENYTPQISILRGVSSASLYYYGDKVVWDPETKKYNLENEDGSAISQVGSSVSLSSLVGKYSCLSTRDDTRTSCETVYYADFYDRYLYYYAISDGKEYDDYNIKLATSITDNGDGTFTLVNPIELTRQEYFNNYRTYEKKEYYYCSDLNSETCNDVYRLIYPNQVTILGESVSNNYKYGNSYKYENGTYTLVDTINHWDLYYNNNTLNNYHYTCSNKSGECTELKYIYYISSGSIAGNAYYYLTLTEGKTLNEIIHEMLHSENVNKTNSTIKDYIDTWYEENLFEAKDENGVLYSKYLENAIFCNNRAITDLSASGFNPNGGNTRTYMHFNSTSLECENKTDRFTLKAGEYGGTEGYGNNALDYPIGILSNKEASLATGTGYLESGNEYWLLTPGYLQSSAPYLYSLLSYGYLYSATYPSSSKGVRPVISLNISVEIDSGDGSVTSPYQVKLSE